MYGLLQIRVFRPPNYAGTIIAALFFILAGTLLYVQRNSLEFLFSKKFWGLIAIVSLFFYFVSSLTFHLLI